jgi:hypothetical protein
MQSSIPIRIENERDVPHLPVGWALLESDPKALESLTSLVDIIDSDSDVAKPTSGIAVPARVALKVGVVLRPVVVRQLEDTWDE